MFRATPWKRSVEDPVNTQTSGYRKEDVTSFEGIMSSWWVTLNIRSIMYIIYTILYILSNCQTNYDSGFDNFNNCPVYKVYNTTYI